MTVALLILVAILAVAVLIRRRPARSVRTDRRIIFPFVGASLSPSALAATLRIARAEGATLVPAFLARVPMNLPLDTALPYQCDAALPLLEAIEHQALAADVPVDGRIERGRTYRHAVRELIEHERFDRIVVAAATDSTDGFTTTDVAWLLDHVPGEVVVLRPGAVIPEGALSVHG